MEIALDANKSNRVAERLPRKLAIERRPPTGETGSAARHPQQMDEQVTRSRSDRLEEGPILIVEREPRHHRTFIFDAGEGDALADHSN